MQYPLYVNIDDPFSLKFGSFEPMCNDDLDAILVLHLKFGNYFLRKAEKAEYMGYGEEAAKMFVSAWGHFTNAESPKSYLLERERLKNPLFMLPSSFDQCAELRRAASLVRYIYERELERREPLFLGVA